MKGIGPSGGKKLMKMFPSSSSEERRRRRLLVRKENIFDGKWGGAGERIFGAAWKTKRILVSKKYLSSFSCPVP